MSGSSLSPPQARSDSTQHSEGEEANESCLLNKPSPCSPVIPHLSLPPRSSASQGHPSSVVQLPSSPPLNDTNAYKTGPLTVLKHRTITSGVTLTCRGLQLLVLLFPPLPRFEDASQAGQLAVTAGRRRTNP